MAGKPVGQHPGGRAHEEERQRPRAHGESDEEGRVGQLQREPAQHHHLAHHPHRAQEHGRRQAAELPETQKGEAENARQPSVAESADSAERRNRVSASGTSTSAAPTALRTAKPQIPRTIPPTAEPTAPMSPMMRSAKPCTEARSAGASASVRSALAETKPRFQPTPLRKRAPITRTGPEPGARPASITAPMRMRAPTPIMRRRPKRSQSHPDSGEATYIPPRCSDTPMPMMRTECPWSYRYTGEVEVVAIITNWLTESAASAICTRTSPRMAPNARGGPVGRPGEASASSRRAMASGSGRRKA